MKIERCPCCGSMLEVSQSDEGTASFISVNGPELKAEVESLREKLAAAEEKVSRFLAAMNADGSTFDFEGALTYLRQDLIPNEEAYSGIQEKLALSESRVKELEEKIKYEADVNAALSKQSQEYWQDRELCAGYNRELTEKLAAAENARDTWEHALKNRDRQFREFMDKWEEVSEFTEGLKEKLALSEAAGASMRGIIEECVAKLKLWIKTDECDCLMDGGVHSCGLPSLQRLISSAETALASDHGKAYLDVVRAAEKRRKAVRALGGVKSGNPVMMAQYYRDAESAYQDLICALDGLPGRKGER